MTFKQIQDAALERLNLDFSSASSAARTRIKGYINEWYRRLLSESGLSAIRTGSGTLSVIANTATYTLTSTGKIRQIYDTSNNWPLVEITLDEIRRLDPDLSITGTPTHYAVTKHNASTVDIRLYPIPAGNNTLNLDVDALVTELSADADVPVIPEDFHWLLHLGARVEEYRKMNDDRADNYEAQLVNREIPKLRYHIAKSRTRQLTQGRRPPRHSRFGSWYPAE